MARLKDGKPKGAKKYWAKGPRRKCQFLIRMSDAEYDVFKKAAKASGLPMVGYARCKLLDLPYDQWMGAAPQSPRR